MTKLQLSKEEFALYLLRLQSQDLISELTSFIQKKKKKT